MKYKIIADSCCELPENLINDDKIQLIPLTLQVGDVHIVDDEAFNQADFLKKVSECPDCPKSACPSPEAYMNAINSEAERVYIITLSSKLSGSYNSAKVGADMYIEEFGHKDIHVVDSESASGGETQIVLKLIELEEQGLTFDEIVSAIEEFKVSMCTYFVLDSLEALRKNGRLSNLKAAVATTLNIKPVLYGNRGEIEEYAKTIGMKKALVKLADAINSKSVSGHNRIVITHCNAPRRAEQVRDMLLVSNKFSECIILDTRGVSSLYASDGGIIVTA